MPKILFICHGNICRSPMAEFIMKHLVTSKNRTITTPFQIASAATSTEEIGNGVHPGTRRILNKLGISAANKTAVQLREADYNNYDYLIAMDQQNIRNMQRILHGDPQGKIHRLLDYTDTPRDIADPWYTGDFDLTYQEIKLGCEALLQHILEEEALAYLHQDPILHASMLAPMQREMAEVLQAGPQGVLLKVMPGEFYMISVANPEIGVKLLDQVEAPRMVVTHQEYMTRMVQEKYGFEGTEICYQAVYTKGEPLPLRETTDIRKLDMQYLDTLCKHYHMIEDPKHMENLITKGVMRGIFLENELAGFIGFHTEGSIGLLEVFPEYRRRGLATELQSYMINQCLEQGWIPFGQVIVGNNASLALQRRMGMEIAQGYVTWIF